jgi:hypothetical protein
MTGLEDTRERSVSLTSGPVAVAGLLLFAYGITGLVFGGGGFDTEAFDGTVVGETWLGIEGSGWTNLLFAAAGALLLVGSPSHWMAKGIALVVGLALAAAAVIAVIDGESVFGILAANGWTIVACGATSIVLLALSALPRTRRPGRRGRTVAGPPRDETHSEYWERELLGPRDRTR